MPVPLSPMTGLVEVMLAPHELPVQRAPVLAFDSSTECLALAACGPAGACTVRAAGGAAASASLLPLALHVLSQVGLQLADLSAIAFGNGPGAFTGLRTACAVAQGLGLGLGLPLLPLDSLLLVAEDARLQLLQDRGSAHRCDVAVLMDARMGEVYAGHYRWHGQPDGGGPHEGHWQVMQAPLLCSLSGLAPVWASWPSGPDVPLTGEPVPTLAAGSALAAFGDRLPLPPHTRQLGMERNRGAALLQLALRAWAAGQGVDPALALPLYVRDKVAQTTQERVQARAAAAAGGAATPQGAWAAHGATGAAPGVAPGVAPGAAS